MNVECWLFNNKGIRPHSPARSKSSSISKGSRKRKCSFSRKPRSSLRSRVSFWEKKTVEKLLHIFYDNDFLDPEDILRKGDIKTELNEEQKQYIEVLEKYLKFSYNFNNLIDDDFKFFNSYNRMEAALLGLENVICMSKKPKKMKGERFEVLKMRVVDFMTDLRILLKKINSGNFQKEFGGLFHDFICSFAKMCCLKARAIQQSDGSVWLNLRGVEAVTSRPDYRFYKYGLDCVMSQTCFSVIKVISDASMRSSYEDLSVLESLEENKSPTHSDTSRSPSFPSSSRMDVSDVSMEGEIKTSIEIGLSKTVLGQHAGELLLDLHKLRDEEKSSKLTMPGMIVDGTKVYLTLLKISKEHYQKLKDNKELTDEDRAIIYYSKPYDILTEWKRNILIKYFMRLNNAEDEFG